MLSVTSTGRLPVSVTVGGETDGSRTYRLYETDVAPSVSFAQMRSHRLFADVAGRENRVNGFFVASLPVWTALLASLQFTSGVVVATLPSSARNGAISTLPSA